MNAQFLLRIEYQARTDYQSVRGQRRAIALAHAYSTQPSAERIAVLDPTGRVIWDAVPAAGCDGHSKGV